MSLIYLLFVKRKKQRKFHPHGYIDVYKMPHLSEHILVDCVPCRIINLIHIFDADANGSQQYGRIYALEEPISYIDNTTEFLSQAHKLKPDKIA